VTTDETSADYVAATKLWNSMSQHERQQLITLALQLHALIDSSENEDRPGIDSL